MRISPNQGALLRGRLYMKKAGDAQAADADAWRVTSETKNARSPAVDAKSSTNLIIAQAFSRFKRGRSIPPELPQKKLKKGVDIL